MTHDIAILIPAYNEEKTILQVVTPLLAYSPHIIVVDDGSTDNTVQILSGLGVTILKHTLNQGKGASLQTGFAHVSGQSLRGVITLDGDGQHNPADIENFILAIQRYPENLIIGARKDRESKSPKYRYYANKIADFLISRVIKKTILDSQSGFRFYPQAFINKDIQSPYKQFGYESMLLILAKKNQVDITHVDIQTLYPKDNRKSYFAPGYDSFVILFILFVELARTAQLRINDKNKA